MSCWGDSWGGSWGDSWGAVTPDVPTPQPESNLYGGGALPREHGAVRALKRPDRRVIENNNRMMIAALLAIIGEDTT